jgi:hypothetical protein
VAEAVTESLNIRSTNTTKTPVILILHELNVTDSGVENGLMDSESVWRENFTITYSRMEHMPRALIF